MTYHDFPWLEDGTENIIEHARRYCVTHKLSYVFTPVNSKQGVMVAKVDFSGPAPTVQFARKEEFPIDFESERDEANKMQQIKRNWLVAVLGMLMALLLVTLVVVGYQGRDMRSLKAIATKDFFDPTWVQWRNTHMVTYKDSNTLCGEVNGKNAYGAYVGFRRVIATDFNFVVIGKDADLMWDDVGCKK